MISTRLLLIFQSWKVLSSDGVERRFDVGKCHKKIGQIGLDNFFVCGHSLGGKVAMKMACDYSHRIKKLLVVDIAPRDYPADHHLPTLKALADLDLIGFNKRKEVDEALAEKIQNWAFRQFLLTNLGSMDGRFKWIPNLDGLIFFNTKPFFQPSESE